MDAINVMFSVLKETALVIRDYSEKFTFSLHTLLKRCKLKYITPFSTRFKGVFHFRLFHFAISHGQQHETIFTPSHIICFLSGNGVFLTECQ